MSRLLKKQGDVPLRSLWHRIRDVAQMDVVSLVRGGRQDASFERLEQLLLEADFGVPVTLRLLEEVERRAKRGEVRNEHDVLRLLREGIERALRSGRSHPELCLADNGLTVVLVVGVNGAGKTTLVGKLSQLLLQEGRRVVLAAGDTFRAGAIDQLRVWSQRTGAGFVGSTPGHDPGAVAFEAVDGALAQRADVLIIDTAGRLHTSGPLMEELRKVVRVVRRRLPGAPHETLLVLDGTVGQNAIAQARMFAESVPVSGLVMTKLDGTARGGIVLAAHEAIDVPVKFVGIGESAEDLVPFDAGVFASDLLRED